MARLLSVRLSGRMRRIEVIKKALLGIVCLAAALPVAAKDEVVKAIAVISPTQGNIVTGTVTFTQEGKSIHVVAALTGLKPGGKHGFHIHEFGDCSAPDASSAGGHFNPMGNMHAGPDQSKRHAGDFGNIVADANGNGNLDLVVDNITMGKDTADILGHAVIVHIQEDDLKTQPTGNAGARIGCGVIGVAKGGVQKAEAQKPEPKKKTNMAVDSSMSVYYTCSHHPNVKESLPGKCPKCDMEMVRNEVGK